MRYRGKRRKGGQQQRLAKVEREHESSSALYALLMTWLAKGILSGVQVHQLAVAAKKDIAGAVEGLQYNDLAKLAQLLHGKNLVKSVHALMARVSPLPSPLQVPLPYKDGLHDAYILLPHEIFAYMLEHQKVWKAKFLADPTRLKDFWKSMQGHPALHKHPLLDRPGYENWCVPISIHGDEVPCYGIGKIWSRSALSFSWCSIAQNFLGGACSQIMLYIFALFEKFVCPSTDQMAGTMETFFKVLSWSLNAMWEGKWPEKDWTGKSFVANTVEWCPKMKCICFLLSFCFVVFAK